MQVRDSTVDVMRLSIIVRNNLEKDGDGSEYHAASSSGAPSGDVKLNHTDAELDFEEQSPDGTGGAPLPCEAFFFTAQSVAALEYCLNLC